MCGCSKDNVCSCGRTYQPNPGFDKPQFKVGDKVYSLLDGWGVVTHVGITYIRVSESTTGTSSVTYNLNGSYRRDGEVVLFHDKPTITPAKKKVKKWRFAVKSTKLGLSIRVTDHHYTEYDMEKSSYDEYTKLPWTEIEE